MIGEKTPVGEVRPSQLLWTYGPGALIDLPSLSVVTLAIDRWEVNRCQPIEEARLLAAVRRELGPQVESLRMPPFQRSEGSDPFSAQAYIGVPVRPFPRWLRCVKCGLLSAYDLGLFECKENRFRPERTRFVHKDCKGSKGDQPARDADAVPARFLLACRNGHLDDFPWHYFVHNGPSGCKGTLRFFESGASLQTENLWVKCDQCGASRNMAHAFGKAGRDNLPSCRGRHPHMDQYDGGCQEQARAVLLGATNSWFPITLSALAIPLSRDPVSQLVQDGWDYFADLDSEAEVAVTIKTLKKTGALPGIDKHSSSAVWDVIQSIKVGTAATGVTGADIKGPEWEVLTDPNPPTDWPHFLSKRVDAPKEFKKQIAGVLLLERLREVNALLGFTRVEAPEETANPADRPPRADLCKDTPRWVPATQVHGEGIFVRFDEDQIQKWEERDAVTARNVNLLAGHRGWRNSRKLDPDEAYPGIRYAMLHTLSHLLIRELALECGYNAASIRERIYADTEGDGKQAGILIYTAAADSDGTLGGLVELGRPENLGRLLKQALTRAGICSSDPLCSEHKPAEDRSLHAAACHACSFVSETSCEMGNRYIDRALLVPTLRPMTLHFSTEGHVDKLVESIIELVSNSPPDKTEQLAQSLRRLSGAQDAQSLTNWAANPRAKSALTKLTTAWRGVDIPAAELAAMLTAASAGYHRAKAEQEIELVWTGPSSQLIATRKTEQALLHVIDAAESRLFITSFVARNVASIMTALDKAIKRGVEISMLLESSDKHGGGVSMDAIGQMRAALPTAQIYFWRDKGDSFAGGKVHAKVAVCDESICFISSANLTGHAMEKNMEAGVLIRGGSLPMKLQNHLEALVTIKILNS